jgi:hypothetical protein
MKSSNTSTPKEEVAITKEQAKDGMSLKIRRGTIVRVEGWTNKHGTNILFVAKVSGVYKIHGEIPDYEG